MAGSAAGDVGGEEADAVAVEGCRGRGCSARWFWGRRTGVALWDASVEGVGDRRVPQAVEAGVVGIAASSAIRCTIR